MAVRKLLPTTPGQRHKIIGTFDTITASAPEKSLVVGGGKSGGRNHDGKMTMRYIGGGHKKKYSRYNSNWRKSNEKKGINGQRC